MLLIAAVIMFKGLFAIQPNQAVALTLFGRYVGSTRTEGLRWANPFLSKKKISLRIRNFDTEHLKVNELDGSPIEIGAIVVWRVVDSAQALFSVDDYQAFVQTQAESAIREMATSYPYDGHDDASRIALKSHAAEISDRLKTEIQGRLEAAGVEIVEARISHLAYAPEIAAAMLRRQQAGAIIAARALIVDGAVGMVEAALGQLAERGVLDLDTERKAQMATNLLVVLCSDQASQPVVNAGSIY
jgi:regulator of protease activity HflC (stomatin/prohibitin superfamily)